MPVILVPWSSDDPDRIAAWEYVRARLPERHVVADSDSRPWCKARAVALCLDAAPRSDVLIVHDADVVADSYALQHAVQQCEAGMAWAIPHSEVRRLSRDSTRLVLDGRPLSPVLPLARHPYLGVEGGGVTVVRSDVYEACPLDPRFVGWGGEDEAWGWALHALYGPPWRSQQPLWHLWHEPAANRGRHASTRDGQILWAEYRRARRAPDRMRELVGSIRAGTAG